MIATTIIEILLTVVILVMVWNEQQLIELEDRVADKLAEAIAKVIVWYRHHKFFRLLKGIKK